MLPARNRKDYEDIPDEVRKVIEFVWLDNVNEAVASALEEAADRTTSDKTALKAASSA